MMRSALGLQATHELLRSGQNFLALSRQMLRSPVVVDTSPVWQSLFIDPLIQLEQQISGNTETLTDRAEKPIVRSKISENNAQSPWNFDRVPSSLNHDFSNKVGTVDPHLGKSVEPAGSRSSNENTLAPDRSTPPLQNSMNPSNRLEVPGGWVHPRPMVPDYRDEQRDGQRDEKDEPDRLMAQSEGYHPTDAFVIPIADRITTMKSIIPSDADLFHRDRNLSSNLSSSTDSAPIPSSDLQLIQTPSRLAQLLQANLQTHLPTHSTRAEFSAGQPDQRHSLSTEGDSLAPAKFLGRLEPVQGSQLWNAEIQNPAIQNTDVPNAEAFTNPIPDSDRNLPATLTSNFPASFPAPLHPAPHQTAIAATESTDLSPSVMHPQTQYPAWNLDDLLDQMGDRLEMEYLRTYGTSGR